jgi:putative transposase
VPKFPRVVVPGYPHHITQRGVRRQRTFFGDADYRRYIELICENRPKAKASIWAYCLMPNHVHMIVVPQNDQSLARLFGVAHQRYAQYVNAIHNWRGHLWQERFYSVVMDESHTLAAIRYVEQNPVRAGLCASADDWQWSSARAHLGDVSDQMIDASFVQELVEDWSSFLAERESDAFIETIRTQTSSGRPSGNDRFINMLERRTGRRIRKLNSGPLPKR